METVVKTFAGHDLNHFKQIERILASREKSSSPLASVQREPIYIAARNLPSDSFSQTEGVGAFPISRITGQVTITG